MVQTVAELIGARTLMAVPNVASASNEQLKVAGAMKPMKLATMLRVDERSELSGLIRAGLIDEGELHKISERIIARASEGMPEMIRNPTAATEIMQSRFYRTLHVSLRSTMVKFRVNVGDFDIDKDMYRDGKPLELFNPEAKLKGNSRLPDLVRGANQGMAKGEFQISNLPFIESMVLAFMDHMRNSMKSDVIPQVVLFPPTETPSEVPKDWCKSILAKHGNLVAKDEGPEGKHVTHRATMDVWLVTESSYPHIALVLRRDGITKSGANGATLGFSIKEGDTAPSCIIVEPGVQKAQVETSVTFPAGYLKPVAEVLGVSPQTIDTSMEAALTGHNQEADMGHKTTTAVISQGTEEPEHRDPQVHSQ